MKFHAAWLPVECDYLNVIIYKTTLMSSKHVTNLL